ncbi:MAG TPA: LPS export ABC transporter permease LptG [Burkholderiaceae bacterium]|nr:LPS export ABC transporter permease LptG [Burkholderiaceae bacterium]
MNTIRRLIYKETIISVALVALGFLALFFFFDFVDELSHIGKSFNGSSFGSYQVQHALLYVLLLMPNHLYELLPITVLIGGVLVMARFAQSSEFTILRTSGLGPGLALKLLVGLGALFIAFTFVVGDYITPLADRTAQLLKARYMGQISIGQTGAWLKEKQDKSAFAVNVSAMSADGQMRGVRLFEFDHKGTVLSLTTAQQATFGEDGSWNLLDVKRREFSAVVEKTENAEKPLVIKTVIMDALRWPTTIHAGMVTTALLKPDRMGTVDLFQYIRHLESNKQNSQMYEIQFWKKVFYPLSCLVMLVLALPFAYLHFRSGGITAYVFVGVLIGISFFVLNNMFEYFGNQNAWNPLLTAAAPSLVYSLFSLGAFGFLIYRR